MIHSLKIYVYIITDKTVEHFTKYGHFSNIAKLVKIFTNIAKVYTINDKH